MALKRKPSKLIQHAIKPIKGELGRYEVESASAPGEHYIVDVKTDECPCKSWSVRRWCSHLNSAHAYHAEIYARIESLEAS